HAGVADLGDAAADELVLQRLRVDLLHAARRLLGLERRDLLEVRLRVLVARPEAFEVETREPAEPTDLDRRAGRHHAVHRRRDERQREVVRVDLPGDVDVFGVPGPPARDDRDVVEPVGPATGLADPDLDFHLATPRGGKDQVTPADPGRGRPVAPAARNAARWVRKPVRMRAVAPHTVSPGSSKKWIARSGPTPTSMSAGTSHRSSRNTSGVRSSSIVTSNTAVTSRGCGTSSGGSASRPTTGASANRAETVTRWSSSATISTASGSIPIS